MLGLLNRDLEHHLHNPQVAHWSNFLVPWLTMSKFLIYTNLANSTLTIILPMLSCTSSYKLAKGKVKRVTQTLDNPKEGWTLEQG